MKEKWFRIHCYSVRNAKNLDEAWDKTLEKWRLKEKGLIHSQYSHFDTCGLCDLYFGLYNCIDCPIDEVTEDGCRSDDVPLNDPAEMIKYLSKIKKESEDKDE